MTPQTSGRDYFNRGHWLTRPQVWLSLAKRRELYEIWSGTVGRVSGLKVLDVGTTPDVEREDSNCLLRWLVQDGAQVSVTSIEDLTPLSEAVPEVQVLDLIVPGQPLPAADQSFDWVFSSAVLEHVGSHSRQLEHIAECGRVGRGVFLTTPARDHWLEFHTKLPLFHWLPRPLHRRILRRLGQAEWASEEWLRLVSRREFQELASQALRSTHDVEFHTVRALGMASNLLLLARPN